MDGGGVAGSNYFKDHARKAWMVVLTPVDTNPQVVPLWTGMASCLDVETQMRSTSFSPGGADEVAQACR